MSPQSIRKAKSFTTKEPAKSSKNKHPYTQNIRLDTNVLFTVRMCGCDWQRLLYKLQQIKSCLSGPCVEMWTCVQTELSSRFLCVVAICNTGRNLSTCSNEILGGYTALHALIYLHLDVCTSLASPYTTRDFFSWLETEPGVAGVMSSKILEKNQTACR